MSDYLPDAAAFVTGLSLAAFLASVGLPALVLSALCLVLALSVALVAWCLR